MPSELSDLFAAKFAHIAYEKDPKSCIEELKLEGWVWYETEDQSSDNGYRGICIIHKNEKTKVDRIVIAHRGTANLDGILDDVEIFFDKEPGQVKAADAFCDRVLKKIAKEQDKAPSELKDECYQIGHSLGGTIAQLVALKLSHRSIAFDCPGGVGILDKKYDPNQVQKYKDFAQKNFRVIQVSLVHMINGFNEQIGVIYTAVECFPFEAWEDLPARLDKSFVNEAYEEYTLIAHAQSLTAINKFLSDEKILSQPQWPKNLEQSYNFFRRYSGDMKAFWDAYIHKCWRRTSCCFRLCYRIWSLEHFRFWFIRENLNMGPESRDETESFYDSATVFFSSCLRKIKSCCPDSRPPSVE